MKFLRCVQDRWLVAFPSWKQGSLPGEDGANCKVGYGTGRQSWGARPRLPVSLPDRRPVGVGRVPLCSLDGLGVNPEMRPNGMCCLHIGGKPGGPPGDGLRGRSAPDVAAAVSTARHTHARTCTHPCICIYTQHTCVHTCARIYVCAHMETQHLRAYTCLHATGIL